MGQAIPLFGLIASICMILLTMRCGLMLMRQMAGTQGEIGMMLVSLFFVFGLGSAAVCCITVLAASP